MALELLLQCQPMLKLMSERAQVVHVCPVLAESEQTCDRDVVTNSEIHFKKEQVIDDTCSRDENEIGDFAECAADSIVRTVESDVCDPVTDKYMVNDLEADTAVSLEVESASEGRVSTSDCDCRDRREARRGSGSAVAQGRNETEEELAEQEEESSLVLLLEQRLQFVLRSLTKLCLSKTRGTKKDKE
jgi:hypothetical protein